MVTYWSASRFSKTKASAPHLPDGSRGALCMFKDTGRPLSVR